jgi:hypothetical protein
MARYRILFFMQTLVAIRGNGCTFLRQNILANELQSPDFSLKESAIISTSAFQLYALSAFSYLEMQHRICHIATDLP